MSQQLAFVYNDSGEKERSKDICESSHECPITHTTMTVTLASYDECSKRLFSETDKCIEDDESLPNKKQCISKQSFDDDDDDDDEDYEMDELEEDDEDYELEENVDDEIVSVLGDYDDENDMEEDEETYKKENIPTIENNDTNFASTTSTTSTSTTTTTTTSSLPFLKKRKNITGARVSNPKSDDDLQYHEQAIQTHGSLLSFLTTDQQLNVIPELRQTIQLLERREGRIITPLTTLIKITSKQQYIRYHCKDKKHGILTTSLKTLTQCKEPRSVYCHECYGRRIYTITYVRAFVAQRHIECLSSSFTTLMTKMLFQCQICSYKWSTAFVYLLHGSGCPGCRGYMIEALTRKAANERIRSSGFLFVKARPAFLQASDSARCKEFDAYCPELKIAIEVDGVQHKKWIPYFHKTEEQFQRACRMDKEKDEQAASAGVKLVRIDYDTVSPSTIRTRVHEILEEYAKTIKFQLDTPSTESDEEFIHTCVSQERRLISDNRVKQVRKVCTLSNSTLLTSVIPKYNSLVKIRCGDTDENGVVCNKEFEKEYFLTVKPDYQGNCLDCSSGIWGIEKVEKLANSKGFHVLGIEVNSDPTNKKRYFKLVCLNPACQRQSVRLLDVLHRCPCTCQCVLMSQEEKEKDAYARTKERRYLGHANSDPGILSKAIKHRLECIHCKQVLEQLWDVFKTCECLCPCVVSKNKKKEIQEFAATCNYHFNGFGEDEKTILLTCKDCNKKSTAASFDLFKFQMNNNANSYLCTCVIHKRDCALMEERASVNRFRFVEYVDYDAKPTERSVVLECLVPECKKRKIIKVHYLCPKYQERHPCVCECSAKKKRCTPERIEALANERGYTTIGIMQHPKREKGETGSLKWNYMCLNCKTIKTLRLCNAQKGLHRCSCTQSSSSSLEKYFEKEKQ